MFDRRGLIKALAAAPFLAPVLVRGQDLSRIAVAPIRVVDDRLWMQVRFGASEPHNFVLDTGAFANLIHRDVAVRMGLRDVGSLRVQGLGGVERMPFYRARDVAIGDVRVGQMLFAAHDEELLIHPQAAGALSAGLLTVADSDLDFDSGLWRLHLDGRTDRTGFEAVPSTIRSDDGPGSGAAKMRVEIAIDGRNYWLEIDTGAPDDIVLAPSGTRRSGLWNDTTPFAPERLRGIGGDGGRARLVRGGSASLGGIRFERPLISLVDPGESLELGSDGLLGIGIVERLNLSTDMRARRIWARRNRRRARPERYGLSGLWLAERGSSLVVEVIGTGSPAVTAGLRRGDRITGGTLRQWIDRLAGRPGETIEIPYERDGQAATTRLTLREYL